MKAEYPSVSMRYFLLLLPIGGKYFSDSNSFLLFLFRLFIAFFSANSSLSLYISVMLSSRAFSLSILAENLSRSMSLAFRKLVMSAWLFVSVHFVWLSNWQFWKPLNSATMPILFLISAGLMFLYFLPIFSLISDTILLER